MQQKEEISHSSLETIVTKNGDYLMGYKNDYLFNNLKGGTGFVDHFLLPVIEKYVKPESVCVDVGANLGYVSLYLSKRCKRVHAFEPQFPVFLQLCTNAFLNQRFNITPYHLALGAWAGEVKMASYQSGWVGADTLDDYSKIKSIGSVSFTPYTSRRNTQDMTSAEMKPLDYITREAGKIPGPLDFIKIDAQGADIDVIIGAEFTIMSHRPVIVFEYENDLSKNNYGRDMSDLNLFMKRIGGYETICLFEGNYALIPKEKM